MWRRPRRSERQSIIVTEIPYQVNKARLIEKIAELVKEKKIEGITDIRDESDREGMRIVIELKRDENAEVLLNQLYKQTQMQTSFGIIMLAIVDNRPRVLTLREMMDCFVEHRCEVVTRRTNFELKKAEARAHILEGLKIALDWLDAVIELIRASKTPPEAKQGLMEGRFADPEYLKLLNLPRPAGYEDAVQLSDIQAQAILEMRLQRLTGLERDKIIAEYEEILRLIARLQEILASDTEILKIIVAELTEIRDKFGDKRRSEIADQTADISLEDTIDEEDMVVTISHTGYIKRSAVDLYRAQRRGGKGKTGMKTKEEDFVEQLFIASTKDYLLFFTDAGRMYWLKVYEIPEGSRTTQGKAIVNLLNVGMDEKITAILPVKEFSEDTYLFMATRKGVVKKTPLVEYSNVRVRRHHRRQAGRRRQADRRGADRRQAGCLPGLPQRQGHPLPRGGCPSHGTCHPRGARHEPGRGRRGHRHGDRRQRRRSVRPSSRSARTASASAPTWTNTATSRAAARASSPSRPPSATAAWSTSCRSPTKMT